MNNILNRTLWFLGGLTIAHFLFEWLFGIMSGPAPAIVLETSRFGIYAVISLAYALFRSSPRLLERDKVLNS
ncbi:MAG: hypothetical protein EA363_06525 [Balneolaceae bacterium]|nr:MAG: hypothetical protein EA363_06525 [Balneolaceae bacterium]